MRKMSKPVALLLGVLVSFGGAASASIRESGVGCRAFSASTGSLILQTGPFAWGLHNVSSHGVTATCPIGAEGSVGSRPDFDITVVDGSTVAGVTCMVAVRDDTDVLAYIYTSTTTVAGTGVFTHSVSADVGVATSGLNYAVHCNLPAIQGWSSSAVAGIRVY